MNSSLAPPPPAAEQRFDFGKNWLRFLGRINEERIAAATRSMLDLLGDEPLAGKTFLDVGSGSGLSSLVAVRLGCARVHSFDYDVQSVACTRELKRRYAQDAQHWSVERGSALDRPYLESLGQWDVVYSWGVLHHTGSMWEALNNVAPLVATHGRLHIALYNDQGGTSVRWRKIKALYNTNTPLRWLVIATCVPYFVLRGFCGDLVRRQNPARRYREYKQSRGMSVVHDWLDWLGGFPFEVAKPEAVLDFLRPRGFALEHVKTCGGSLGCNEFVFRKL
jgi:2-polyprenyl-6-hydroxyphenyl methylase/3-demethylubiquinone-9 3-methyltransferase